MSLAFEVDQFIADCHDAFLEREPQKAMCEVVARAVADQASMLRILGQSTRGEIQKLHVSDKLTVLNVIWAPRMTLMPHNHEMWAVIGVYGGREDNIFWRRLPGGQGERIEARGAKSLGEKDVVPLGRDIIHSVTNPVSRLTGAIHIYAGDFFTVERSEWDPETLLERRYDLAKNMRLFDEASAAPGMPSAEQ